MTIIVVALYFDNRISGASSTEDKELYIYVRMYLSCGNIERDISDINRIYIFSIDY
jgi:hypothetical protein